LCGLQTASVTLEVVGSEIEVEGEHEAGEEARRLRGMRRRRIEEAYKEEVVEEEVVEEEAYREEAYEEEDGGRVQGRGGVHGGGGGVRGVDVEEGGTL
jgi:hypothetical protein